MTRAIADSHTITLEEPSLIERQKIRTPNGWICHNGVRERQINDKLQELQIKVNSCQLIKEKALDVSPEINLFPNTTFVIAGLTISFSLGLVAGILLIK
ncbi:MAG: hypothetical protein COT84_01990 [Chlamydiae bacterium CG10_big_fil_rev_8_21_14_0_10_35_9]|nr:MAG: hypothetical protein COT84_01990 [Chlamydiae bacterium CG10_big_fil_rev_8_21_14_0_10_35_9]